ncbi:MAG: hypothetical protein U5L96_00730 [Owenweeksia sp.]|nr:hypothetical protein [Owenweeksia sp.]
MNKLTLGLLTLFLGPTLMAQSIDWIAQMKEPQVNLYNVQQSFENYSGWPRGKKGKGWKQFKRWSAFWEPRVYPEGNLPNPAVLYQGYLQMQQSQGAQNLGQWKPLGPYDGASLNGIGRITGCALTQRQPGSICRHTSGWPLIRNDGGRNWTPDTDLLPNLGVSISPLTPEPGCGVYATGDRDGGDTYSYGILKSTDGGTDVIKSCGLSSNVQFQVRAHDVYVSPADTGVVMRATRSGMYRIYRFGRLLRTKCAAGSYNGLAPKVRRPTSCFYRYDDGKQLRISAVQCRAYLGANQSCQPPIATPQWSWPSRPMILTMCMPDRRLQQRL